MNPKDREVIQRMLGLIEGVAVLMDDKFSGALYDAVATIDELLDKEDKGRCKDDR